MTMTPEEATRFAANLDRLVGAVEEVLLGKNRVVRLAFTAFLSEGHLLLDDVPGTGKVVEIAAFQRQMVEIYGERDAQRGLARTFAWFTEEVGELSRALFRGTDEERRHEFADVLAWLSSLAAQVGVDLEEAASRYAEGCPQCSGKPCACPPTRWPL
jgi:NTP pyrophosphatase (non-canonical NTP hydrolase)